MLSLYSFLMNHHSAHPSFPPSPCQVFSFFPWSAGTSRALLSLSISVDESPTSNSPWVHHRQEKEIAFLTVCGAIYDVSFSILLDEERGKSHHGGAWFEKSDVLRSCVKRSYPQTADPPQLNSYQQFTPLSFIYRTHCKWCNYILKGKFSFWNVPYSCLFSLQL